MKTCSRFRAYGVRILRLALAVKNTILFPLSLGLTPAAPVALWRASLNGPMPPHVTAAIGAWTTWVFGHGHGVCRGGGVAVNTCLDP